MAQQRFQKRKEKKEEAVLILWKYNTARKYVISKTECQGRSEVLYHIVFFRRERERTYALAVSNTAEVVLWRPSGTM